MLAFKSNLNPALGLKKFFSDDEDAVKNGGNRRARNASGREREGRTAVENLSTKKIEFGLAYLIVTFQTAKRTELLGLAKARVTCMLRPT